MTSVHQLLFALLLLAGCSAVPLHQKTASFSTSLSFTRKIRAQVQNLLLQYKGEQLGDEQFEDRDLTLKSLPSITMEYTYWLQMQDWERLSQAKQDLQTFWAHLDIKRGQLQEEEKEKQRGKQGLRLRGRPAPPLTQAMLSVQMDLRDLIQQVDSQVAPGTSSLASASSPSLETTQEPILGQIPWDPAHGAPLLPSLQLWASRLQGYVILRDLSCYLGKLARDFTLLASEQRS
ncbi:interleukin-27 subunit alpha-like [Arapaima gigas]